MSVKEASNGRAIVVVGMHRSGTSALTRVLNLLGVHLGDHLLPPGKGNRQGHWEHQGVVTVHEKLLNDLDMSWEDTRALPEDWTSLRAARDAKEQLVELLSRDFSDKRLWAVKDPRICRFLPLWKLVLAELGVEANALFVVRNPAEVTGSLRARDGLDCASMRLSWLEHMADAEVNTRSWRRTVVAYDDLLSDWRRVMTTVEAQLKLRWPNTTAEAEAKIDTFLDKGERHNYADPVDGSHDPVDKLYSCLAVCARDERVWEAVSGLVDSYHCWSPTFLRDIERRHIKATQLGVQLKRVKTENSGHVDLIRDQEQKLHGMTETIYGKDAQIQNLDVIIKKRDLAIATGEKRIVALTEAFKILEQRNTELVQERLHAIRRADDLQINLDLVTHSRSWRLTAPLRALNKVAGSLPRMGRALACALGHPLRYLRFVRELGFAKSLSVARQFMLRGGPKSKNGNLTAARTFDVRSQHGQPVGILTTRHCLFIAELIADALKRLGISSEVLLECPPEGFKNVPHFVICPQMFEQLPNLYVAFQMEQSVSSRWLTKEYLRTLENSFAIFDYSITNIKKLTDMGLSPRQFFYLPVGPLLGYKQDVESNIECEYDVIFYGDINNARRQAFLGALEKVCRVKVIGDLFGASLYEELRKARLIVNIHYYEGALLETTRLWECLSLGKFVVSERSSDMHEHEDLANLVDFVDVGDMNGMVEHVRYWLDAPDELEARVRANEETISGSFNYFDYFFYRFMLYSGNLSFQDFWKLVGEKLPAPNEKLCLNLPEYVDRSEAFDKDNRYGFVRFAGLKHPYGWMGCAMSYKFMAMWAQKYGLSRLIVCEDDVEFPVDFDAIWGKLDRHLRQTRDSWDLFSGILADLHEEAEILESYVVDGETYVVLDRMISTVYNVYNPKVLSLLAEWDDENYDVESNTIDRYLERCTDLRVMTTLPFLVGHKEELYSTLWGMQNTQYIDLIEASQDLLRQKVEKWHVRTGAKT